jgi:CubicO group peptidase (beta-lactamase class C family)
MNTDATRRTPLDDMPTLLAAAARDAERAGFSGVIRVDARGQMLYESAHGLADRAHSVPNTCRTRFAAASGTKGYTAAVVMVLVERGVLSLGTTARSLLGSDLPLIDDQVTIEHLLGHRSGIGDYLDESTTTPINDRTMEVPVHAIDSPIATLTLLADRPMTDRPGTRFAYNNGGYALLALLAERATGTSFYDLLQQFVSQPARQQSTDIPRTDELPGDTAIGYLDSDGLRCNSLHVPVRGLGDGGVYTTTEDMARFWQALFAGEIVRPATLALMTIPQGHTPGRTPYGLGLWLDPHTDAVDLEGYDAGISFRSVHQPSRQLTWTIISNWSDGAWPLTDRVGHLLGTSTPTNPGSPSTATTEP